MKFEQLVQRHQRCGRPSGMRDGVAYWAIAEARDLVVFVHGFNGECTTTWGRFADLLSSAAEFANTDIVFFGYDGRDERASQSAQDLMTLLELLAIDPLNAVINDSSQELRRAEFQYERILVVAHSLGAIVSRLAMLRSQQLQYRWQKKARLVLFAPAHHGAETASLLHEHGLSSLVIQVAGMFGKFSALLDLPIDSPTVGDLKARTARALQLGDSDCHRAVAVLHAARESVVPTIDFFEDAPFVSVVDTTHKSICKARDSSSKAYLAVKEALR